MRESESARTVFDDTPIAAVAADERVARYGTHLPPHATKRATGTASLRGAASPGRAAANPSGRRTRPGGHR